MKQIINIAGRCLDEDLQVDRHLLTKPLSISS